MKFINYIIFQNGFVNNALNVLRKDISVPYSGCSFLQNDDVSCVLDEKKSS